MNITDWIEQGKSLAQDLHRQPWRISDWILEGQRSGDSSKYESASRILKMTPGACRVSACIGRAFPTAERYDILTFGHHAAVAALEPDERRRLLDSCVDTAPSGIRSCKLSVGKLRAAVRELKGKKLTPNRPDLVNELRSWIKQVCPSTSKQVYIQSSAYGIVERSSTKDSTPVFDLELRSITAEQIKAVCEELQRASTVKAKTPEPPPELAPVYEPSPDDFVPAGTVLFTPSLFDAALTETDAVACREELDALQEVIACQAV